MRLAGFLALAGLLAAALYGTQFHILLAAVAVVPVLFALTAWGPSRDEATLAMATTLFGVYWVGFALAHAVLLRDLPHGDAIVIDVLVGTFIGDTGAYFGGRDVRPPPAGAAHLARTRRSSGLVIGMRHGARRRLHRRPLPGLALRHRRAAARRSASRSPPRSATSSSRSSSATSATRTPARRSAPTAAHSTASTPRSFAAVVGYYVWYALA